MGRRGKRRKFGAAGGEFSQGEFTSPENFKNQWVPAGPSGPVGIGFSVVDVGDDGKIADLGLIGHKYRYLLGESRRFLFCRRMSLNLRSQEISPHLRAKSRRCAAVALRNAPAGAVRAASFFPNDGKVPRRPQAAKSPAKTSRSGAPRSWRPTRMQEKDYFFPCPSRTAKLWLIRSPELWMSWSMDWYRTG